MSAENRAALAEYLEARRQMKSAWDAFHRQSYRHTFIHCRLALWHFVSAAVLLEHGDPGNDPLPPFFNLLREEVPLEKAAGFDQVLYPPELKPLGPVSKETLSESVVDWMVTRKISRSRAFELLNLAQEMANGVIRIIEKRHPRFFEGVKR